MGKTRGCFSAHPPGLRVPGDLVNETLDWDEEFQDREGRQAFFSEGLGKGCRRGRERVTLVIGC